MYAKRWIFGCFMRIAGQKSLKLLWMEMWINWKFSLKTKIEEICQLFDWRIKSLNYCFVRRIVKDITQSQIRRTLWDLSASGQFINLSTLSITFHCIRHLIMRQTALKSLKKITKSQGLTFQLNFFKLRNSYNLCFKIEL